MKLKIFILLLCAAAFAANEYTPTYGPVGTNEFTPVYGSGNGADGDAVTQYTVTYNANGGTGSAAAQTQDSGSTVTLSSGGTIARVEYVLDGWNTAANGSGTDYALGGSLTPLIESVTMYAQWIWDTLEVYGIRQDTAEVGDTIAIGWHCPNYEAATVTTGETEWTVIGTTDEDTLRLAVPSVPLDSFYAFSICDEVSCDTTTDSIFIKSNDVTQFTIDTSNSGGSADRVVFSHFGLVDSGTEVTVTITTASDSIWYISGDTAALAIAGYTFVLDANYTVTFSRMQRNPITFTTTNNSFTPRISPTGAYRVLWIWYDGTTSSDTMPTKTFAYGDRNHQLVVYPWTAVKKINLGYDGSDGGGVYNPITDYHPRQYVSHVSGLQNVSDSLEKWYSLQNSIDSLDFSGFDRIDAIENYFGSTEWVDISNCPLLRRICFEANGISALDISTCPRMADIRAAMNNFTSVTFASVQDSLWHLCLQNGALNTLPSIGTTFPVLRELWVWACHLTADPVITTENTELNSIRLDSNDMTRSALDAMFDSLMKVNRENAQGWIYTQGNAGKPSARIVDSIAILEADDWHVTYDGFWPTYTRDTVHVFSGALATVEIAPATLSPVDSATACTTSVSGVAEGYRCDSIVSIGATRQVVYYPATRITYTITGNRIDSVFINEIPVIPDSSTLTLDQTVGGTVAAEPPATRRAAGDESVITATDTGHYHFVAWLDDLADSTGNPLTYIYGATGSYTGSALFGIDSFTTTAEDIAHATVTGGGTPKPYGAYDTIVAVSDQHYRVSIAGGAWVLYPGTARHIVQVIKDSTVIVTATILPEYTIDTTIIGEGAWTISGGLTRDSASTVTYYAYGSTGYRFSDYNGTYSGTNRSASYVITANHTDTCTFIEGSEPSQNVSRSGLWKGFVRAWRSWR